MITNKIGSERLTFPNNDKRYSETKVAKSLNLIENKSNNKKNKTQQNSAKREGHSEKEIENKIKRNNISK